MRMRLAWMFFVGVGAALTIGRAVQASDGTIELNQTCAVQTGCFAGDAPGFPITIGSTGSYRLTSSLTVAANGVDGIQINGPNVWLDLGGFELSGPISCTGHGASLVCPGGAGNGFGIVAFGESARVRNGAVRGFSAGGVAVGSGQGESLRVEQNGGTGFSGRGAFQIDADRNLAFGISVSEGIVRDCIATRNGANGINGFSSRIVDSVASSNGQIGIRVFQASVVSDNVSRTNGTQGISASGGVIRNNAVELSGSDSIVGNGALIVGNSVSSSSQAAIVSLSSASVLDNVVNTASGIGLYLFPELGGPPAAYRGNVVRASPSATTVVNGVNMGQNSCNGGTTCP